VVLTPQHSGVRGELAAGLFGWGMLFAAPYPVTLFGSLHLPPILPQNATLCSWLRHGVVGVLHARPAGDTVR
jgi:hypothetical protein